MKFGRFPLGECTGAILAHTLRAGKLVIRKGTVLSDDDLRRIADEGVTSLIVAIAGAGDVNEDVAAARIAAALQMRGAGTADAGTGRVNFYASHSGVLRVSKDAIDAVNAIDPGITFATLGDFEPVRAGRMVATVKIIPYAVAESAVRAVEELAARAEILTVHGYQAKRIGMISTRLPSLKDSTIAKTERVLEARLEPSGSTIAFHDVVGHEAAEVEQALRQRAGDCDLLIVFGASAICDDRDVIPEGLRSAGGRVIRLGMPVDPGNLLMLGELDGKPVLGAPGCARSPARNGFDFVLERLLAGVDVSSGDVAGMGAGGLLMEIASRPQPREAAGGGEAERSVTAIVLAAGQSRRMGDDNKLLLEHGGKPILRHVVEAALGAGSIGEVLVVTGHEASAVEAALAGLDVRFAHNAAYEEGLSASLRRGIEAIAPGSSHALILLGDMPGISAAMIERMASALGGSEGRVPAEKTIVVATSQGKRGNPVLWPRSHFEALASISGDTGARHIIGQNRENVVEVEIGEAAALDVDTPEAYVALKDR